MGISYENGREHFQIFPKSVDGAKFREYLERLRAANGDEKICLFLDNLSVHRSKESQAAMRSLGFRWIFNVPYAFQLQPIEHVFQKVKSKFKALRAQKMMGLIQDGHEAMVRKAVTNVRKQDVRNSIDHVKKLL